MDKHLSHLEKITSSNHTITDLTGKRVGRWLILYRADNIVRYTKGLKKSQVGWYCRCDCGTEKIVAATSLIHQGTHSCGCYRSDMITAVNKKNTGENNYSYIKDRKIAVFRKVFIGYKSTAKRYNRIFNLSFDEFTDIIQKPCVYCGLPPSNIRFNEGRSKNEKYPYSGIDRIDSSIGYVMGNVVSCCWDCNRNKGGLSKEQFLAWVERVYNHSIRKQGVQNV
jgi:hypothetical protein